jgi:hypothetical protein
LRLEAVEGNLEYFGICFECRTFHDRAHAINVGQELAVAAGQLANDVGAT